MTAAERPMPAADTKRAIAWDPTCICILAPIRTWPPISPEPAGHDPAPWLHHGHGGFRCRQGRDHAPAHGPRQDRVDVQLPVGERMSIAVLESRIDGDAVMAAVVKDAGDDPDVTHRAVIRARVQRGAGSGVTLRGGSGVGVVTPARPAPSPWACQPSILCPANRSPWP